MTTYEISPAVTEAGEPIWTLWRTTACPFAVATVKEASNKDRTVLERAIEHLTAGRQLKEPRDQLYAGHAVGNQSHESDPRASQWTVKEQAELAARNSPPTELRNLNLTNDLKGTP